MVHCASMPDNSRRGVFKALFSVLVWGASFVATKVSLRYVEPAVVVWLRFAVGVAILGMAVVVRRQFRLPDRKDWLYLERLRIDVAERKKVEVSVQLSIIWTPNG
ncbi:MAG: hypothetical protein C0393_02710 [Anaerolinea sp.]|nr:hypothetical protein [Anaerolinea sp.]